MREASRRVGDDGFSAVIYGDRGVGKTSFGWQLLETLSESGCKCIWFQCQDYMKNVEHVLAGVMRESLGDYSFKSHFPKLYEDKQVNDTIQRKYGFNFGVVSADLIFKKDDSTTTTSGNIKSINPLIGDMFKDVVQACKSLYPDSEIVIFLDEFDSLPEKDGIGQMIKGVDHARFVIIGIADNVDEIVVDHPSAERKLADSKFKVPGLESSEVEWLFDRAEEESKNQKSQVKFDSEFRDGVISMSNGFPYLVQQFGYFAMQAAQDANPLQNPLLVTQGYLSQAIDRLFKDKKESTLFAPLFKVLDGTGKARKEILNLVSSSDKPLTKEEIRNQVSPNLKQFVDTNSQSLIKENILKLTDRNELRFANPEARILTQLHFDQKT